MQMIDIYKLKELASAATPGNWGLYENPPVKGRHIETLTGDSHYLEDGPYMAITSDLVGAEDREYYTYDENKPYVVAANARYYPTSPSEEDMRYIAAIGPRTILALIAELETLRGKN